MKKVAAVKKGLMFGDLLCKVNKKGKVPCKESV